MKLLSRSGMILLVAVCSLLVPFAAFGGEIMELSLADAIGIALEKNHELNASRLESEAATRRVGQARAAFFPRLDIIEGFSYSDDPGQVFSGLLGQASLKQRHQEIRFLNEPTPLTNLESQIRLEQTLYTGGKRTANLELAKASEEASREIGKRNEQDVIARVTEAYYRVMLSEENLGVVDKALLSARAHLKRARDLFGKGLVVRSDVLRTEVLVGSLEREKIQAESSVRISRLRLTLLMGLEDQDFRLIEAIVAAALPLEPLRELIAKARELRPDFKAAEKRVESAKRAVQVSQADYYPSLGFVTQFEGNTRRFHTSGENFAVFVTAKWNIFSGFVTQERVEEARALLERATVVRTDLGQRIGLEVEEAYLGLLAAGRQVAVARENVDQAAESLRIIAARYSAGLARNVDVLDAEAALKSAEQDLLRARVDTHLFRSRLNFAIGRPRFR